MNPTERFRDRAADYARYRPGYPDELHRWLLEGGLPERPDAVDLGAGTGISSEYLLRHGCTVTAVEPNPQMHAAAVAWLGGRPGFRSVRARAEQTGLASRRFDLAAAFKAAHWFNLNEALTEMDRLVRPGGWIVMAWNLRSPEKTAIAKELESLLLAKAVDYQMYEERRLTTLSALADFELKVISHRRILDWPSFSGLVQSWSYVPAPSYPRHAEFFLELRRIFDAAQTDGRVEFHYDCHAYRLAR